MASIFLPGGLTHPGELIDQLVGEGIFRDEESATRYMKRDYAIKRFASPEDVAASVAFLCRPETACITAISLPVDGGFTKH